MYFRLIIFIIFKHANSFEKGKRATYSQLPSIKKKENEMIFNLLIHFILSILSNLCWYKYEIVIILPKRHIKQKAKRYLLYRLPYITSGCLFCIMTIMTLIFKNYQVVKVWKPYFVMLFNPFFLLGKSFPSKYFHLLLLHLLSLKLYSFYGATLVHSSLKM